MRKIGKIKISAELLHELMMDPSVDNGLLTLFKNFIPVMIDHNYRYIDNTIHYTGICDAFKPIPEGEVPPEYDVTIARNGKKIEIKFTLA